MKSVKLKSSDLLRVHALCDEISLITGWRVAEVFAKEEDKEPTGILIGDVDFFEAFSE